MSPRGRLRRTYEGARTVLAVLISVGLVLGGSPADVRAQATQDGIQESLDDLDAFVETVRTMRASFDVASFDVEELAFELAFEDAETITTRVHELVAYEPYLGVLRGPQGTLASGGGNAADQALLLARLLGDAGYETRVQRVMLDASAAERVLAQVRARTPDGGPRADAPTLEELVPDLAAEDAAAFTAELEAIDATIHEEAERAAIELEARAELGRSVAPDLVEVARDYLWVEFRLGADAAWESAHPVLGTVGDAFGTLEPEETFEAQIPETLQHRLRISASIEVRRGDELATVPIMNAWERPTANLYGVPLSFAVAPSEGGAALDGETPSFFVPVFENGLAPGGMFFDLAGNVVPPEAAANPAAGVFQEVGGAFGEAGGALGGLGGDDDAPATTQELTRVFWTITTIAPDGTETDHERTLVDRIGADRRADGATTGRDAMDAAPTIRQLVSAHTLIVDTGRYGSDYVDHRSLGIVTKTFDYLHATYEALAAGTRPPEYGQEYVDAEEALAPLQLARELQRAPLGPDIVSFRPSPAVVVLSQRGGDRGAEIDIVANPRWSLAVGEGSPTFDPEASLRAGVWETRVEMLPLQARGDARSPALDALLGEGGVRLVRSSTQRPELGAMPAESVAAIERDLDRGYDVLVPASPDATIAGWWRVDPATGETLGRGGDGRGQVILEEEVLFFVGLGISAAFAMYGVKGCTEIEDDFASGCCIVQNVALAGLGVAIGAIFFTAAWTAFFAMDVGYNVGTALLPPVCGS